ncbi:MAG: galactokinase, partial [Cyclobacteriaceae bacterium]
MDAEKIKEKFFELYKKEPQLVRSPGRVNLIGEHTDYNQGFVLPASIDKEVVCALAKNNSSICQFYAFDLKEKYEVDLSNLQKSEKGWPDYLMGVIEQVQKAGHEIDGFDCVIGGDIPLGAGLSSSAAIECAMVFGINELFQLNIDRLAMVKMAQMAENEFVGVKCGIMDQFASMFGEPESVIKLDCRTLEYEHFHFDMSDYIIVLCDTNVKHSLASSEYNTRRKECESGVALVQKKYSQVKSLRD